MSEPNFVKVLIFAAIVTLLVGCSATNKTNATGETSDANKGKLTLPSGSEITITGMNGLNFENGETGLVLNYQTAIPIENLEELKKEVEEVWTIFRVDVEKAKTTVGVIRATHMEDGGLIVKSGKGYGFVFRKNGDGKWTRIEKE